MVRHLPPTTSPIALSDLGEGLNNFKRARSGFQAALADYLGVPICGLASSGRTALYLLLKGLAEGAGPRRHEVLLPAYTCPALVKVVLDVGLQPRLVDISAQTLALQPDQLEASLGEQTLAVICVHPFGLPQDIEEVMTLATAAGAWVIEDAAQAMGARLGGVLVGTRGDFGLFSLGPGKPLSTGGGGIICARTPNAIVAREVARTWQELSPPSALASGWALLRLALLSLAFHPLGWWLATRLSLHRAGEHQASWGYRCTGLTESQAGIGLRLLARLDRINRQRRQKAEQLMAHLQVLDFVHIPPVPHSAEPIYLRLPVLVADEAQREALFQQLWAAGIGVGRMYGRPLSEIFPDIATQPYPGAAYVARHLLTLPTHHYLTGVDTARIVRIFQMVNQ